MPVEVRIGLLAVVVVWTIGGRLLLERRVLSWLARLGAAARSSGRAAVTGAIYSLGLAAGYAAATLPFIATEPERNLAATAVPLLALAALGPLTWPVILHSGQTPRGLRREFHLRGVEPGPARALTAAAMVTGFLALTGMFACGAVMLVFGL